MMSLSRRILAGILAVLILPLAALGLGNEASTPANKTAATEASSAPAPAATPAPPALNSAVDPLLQLLVTKGVLSSAEVNSLASAPANQMRDQLLLLLKAKGVLSNEDLNALKTPSTAMPVAAVSASSSAASAVASTAPDPADPQGGGAPTVVPAVAPLRVLQTDPPKREGFIPDISIGKNIRLKPYGFFKTSVVYDTASPYGNDFPLPGFIGDINTVDKMPEFHVKARALRLGTNFEWLDPVPKVVITGKLELDFEGNFSR